MVAHECESATTWTIAIKLVLISTIFLIDRSVSTRQIWHQVIYSLLANFKCIKVTNLLCETFKVLLLHSLILCIGWSTEQV